MPVATACLSNVLDRLKAETRAEHTAMEGTLGLMHDDLALAHYRQLLERYFGFYAPVEARLAEVLGVAPPGGLDVQARHKLALLRADLVALGEPAPDTLALCTALPPLHTPAQAMGCLYVLEGATLGGMVIGRHVQRTLGLTPDSGARFFHGNGAHTAELWRDFRAALVGFAAQPGIADVVVTSANDTFRSLRHWCLRERAA